MTQSNKLHRAFKALKTANRHQYLLWGLYLFILGFFLMPKAAGHARLYYLLVIVPLCFSWAKTLELIRSNTLLKLLALFCTYLVLRSLSASDVSPSDLLLVSWHALLVLSFPVTIVLINDFYPEKMDQLLQSTINVAAAFAVLSMTIWYMDHPFSERLYYWGRMDSPNTGGCVYGLFSILAVHFGLSSKHRPRSLVFFLLAAILAASVLFTQSRTAISAYSVALFILLLRSYPLVTAPISIIFLIAALMSPTTYHLLVLNRGLSFRPDIAAHVLQQLSDNWLVGLGLTCEQAVTISLVSGEQIQFNHDHGHLLATYRDGGLIALVILASILIICLFNACKSWVKGQQIYLALFAFSLMTLISIQDRLITRPREHWLYFLLPISLLIAQLYQQSKQQGPETRLLGRVHIKPNKQTGTR